MPDQTQAYINRIATAVPEHEVNAAFQAFARSLLCDAREQQLFGRMAERSGIENRYSCIRPSADPGAQYADADRRFSRGSFPGTATRMALYEENAPGLAQSAVERLELEGRREAITHLIVTSCTGLSAPGIDLELVQRCGLSPSIERTMVGFMGCYAAINALKLARHIVRSDPAAQVLTVNIELCTLHLQETHDLETLLSFCLWSDGCAAALVTAEAEGFRIDSFKAVVASELRDLMTWNVRDQGFDMVLSGQVPSAVHRMLRGGQEAILRDPVEAFGLWAIHPGGRTVLDAVQQALDLPPAALRQSREVLRRYGNMSSATVMFVLAAMLGEAHASERGCAMAFGPGLTAETMLFRTAA